MPEPTPLNPPKSEAQEIFDYLSEWIERHGDEGISGELLGWLVDHDAVRKQEIEPYGEFDEFYLPAGGGIVLFTHMWHSMQENTFWKHSYSLTRYAAVDQYKPTPAEPIARLL